MLYELEIKHTYLHIKTLESTGSTIIVVKYMMQRHFVSNRTKPKVPSRNNYVTKQKVTSECYFVITNNNFTWKITSIDYEISDQHITATFCLDGKHYILLIYKYWYNITLHTTIHLLSYLRVCYCQSNRHCHYTTSHTWHHCSLIVQQSQYQFQNDLKEVGIEC